MNEMCFEFWAFTPITPLPKTQNGKRNFKIFKISFLSENKKKGIHQLTRHIWLRLFIKTSTQIANATSDIPIR